MEKSKYIFFLAWNLLLQLPLKGERKHGLQSIVMEEFFLALILPLENWDLHDNPQEFYHTVEGCELRFNRDSAIAALKLTFSKFHDKEDLRYLVMHTHVP